MKRSRFDLSHEKKLTMKANGTLYPIMCEPVLPGDKFRVTSECLARMTPLINPVYHRFDITTHYFYVPNRLIWDNWTKFLFPEIAELGEEDTHVFPTMKIIPANVSPTAHSNEVDVSWVKKGNTLADYLGCGIDETVPMTTAADIELSVLPFRALALIWNEWYRDQDLQEKLIFSTGDGFNNDDNDSLLFFKKRCWEKDYFTSARPWPQKGAPAVVASTRESYLKGFPNEQEVASQAYNAVTGELIGDLQMTTNGVVYANESLSEITPISIDGAQGFTIEDFRYANAVQKFLEKLSRHGSRYVEAIRSFFGVTVPDFRLQRPEYLGGGKQPIVISEVLQQSQSDETPLGTYAGHGISSGKAGFKYMFPEHGYVIGLCSIMPRSGYMNIIRKEFFKNTRFDFPFPEFAHLGEQEIIRAEIRGKISPGEYPELVWGYQERYSEYKFIPSTTHGLFNTDVNLVNFHANRRSADYELNSDFVQITNSDDIERIFALDAVNYDPFLVDIVFNVDAIRPVPMHQKPTLG